MKIEYTNKQPSKNPMLADLKSGEVFRPINSRNTFMRCDLNGESRLLSECGSDIWGDLTLVGSEPFDNRDEFVENNNYDELIVCANLTTGGVTLFYDGIEVERVVCKLLVEEN